MNTTNAMLVSLLVLCSVQAGWILARWLDVDAHAQDPVEIALDAVDEPAVFPGRLVCRTFKTDPEGPELVLPGDDSDAGQWVRTRGDQWQLYTVDFEIGQKPTGYPQSWVQVCLAPR